MFIIGLTLISFSIPSAVYMFYILNKVKSNPYAYRFVNGMTESKVEIIAILSVIAIGIGIFLMIFGWINRKNQATLNSIENRSKQIFCTNCNVNVSSTNSKCPICGNKLEER